MLFFIAHEFKTPLLRFLRPLHTTAMDGGSAEIAGANFGPYVPVYKKPRHLFGDGVSLEEC